MVEYRLATEEQKQLAMEARKILEKELKPRLEELENANDGHGEFPVDVLKIMANAGYYAMDIPEEYGGLGFDNVTQCIIYEEIAKVDAGFAFNMHGADQYWEYIEKSNLSHEDKQAWADRLLAGEALGAFCLTEAQAGSDAAALKTTAVFDEKTNEWGINGTKCFVTNGPCADHFFVVAWTDKTKSSGKGMTMFLVEKERGVEVGSVERKLGLKLSCTSEIIFNDVRVPADHVIGEVGQGFKIALSTVNKARVITMIFGLGIAQAAVDYAVEYAQTRETFGKRIIDHQGLSFLIANMQIRIDASRALLYYGAQMLDQGLPMDTVACSTKVFVSDSTMQTAIDAVQVFGGYGYMKDYPVEKLMRDAKIFQIFDGTNQINQMVIASTLDKLHK